MSSSPKDDSDNEPLRFSLRKMLVVVTLLCLLSTLLALTLDFGAQLFAWYLVLLFPGSIWYGLRSYRKNQQELDRIRTEGLIVRVDPKWLRRVQSPLFMFVCAFTGVSVSFAPLGLVWCGDFRTYGLVQWIVAPICLLLIYFVPGFYMDLASQVLAQLYKHGPIDKDSENADEEAIS